jgi:ubiquinone/menaquinone biosynthesis C-methylase UbiE/uncharacterized protein YbaR (Trm112 family)
MPKTTLVEEPAVSLSDDALFELLMCPSCQGSLEARDREDAVDRLLHCECGRQYPVVADVPRFVPYECSIPHAEAPDRTGASRQPTDPSAEDDYDNIRRSFSQEWAVFDYGADRTWGWTREQRKQVFLGDMGLPEDQLPGLRLLDAGCGNGTLTAALSDFGLEVVGLDLHDNLAVAHRDREHYGTRANTQVRFVQGNLVNPPLRPNSFDLVYSSGVIHHTPSSERAFDSLVCLTKRGGRLYVWVYGKRPILVRTFMTAGRSLKAVASLRTVMRLCQWLAPAYGLAASVLDGVRLMSFRPRTTREITLDLFDAFAPRYNHWHTEAEVRSWFERRGFKNVTSSGRQKHGFGMFGDRL